MTPKEKAIELIDKFTFSCIECDFHSNAKQCALIAVDEIIKVAPIDKYENLDSMFSVEHVRIHLFEEYWEQVKTEIQNL